MGRLGIGPTRMLSDAVSTPPTMGHTYAQRLCLDVRAIARRLANFSDLCREANMKLTYSQIMAVKQPTKRQCVLLGRKNAAKLSK